MNKTAVSWLVEELQKAEYIPTDSTITDYVIGVAKEMENDNLKKAFEESRLTHPILGFKHKTFNDYRKETYG